MHGRTPENLDNFPGTGQGSLHICVGTLYAKDIFREKVSIDEPTFEIGSSSEMQVSPKTHETHMKLPWGSTLNIYFGRSGIWVRNGQSVLVLVWMLLLMLVLESVLILG